MTDHEPLRVLTVCTANICRSPVAERTFQAQFDRLGIPAIVRSAGTHGGELAITPEVVKAATEIGVQVTGHQSSLLTAKVVAGADLVVTMTREHLREVVALDPSAWPVSFTLKELARRSDMLPPGGYTVSGWLDRVADGRTTADLMGFSEDDDLIDPYGGPYKGYVEMVGDVALFTRQALSPLRRGERGEPEPARLA